MATVGESFAGFGRERPDAGVGGVAEGVEVGLLLVFFFLRYGAVVCAYEEFVVVVVVGDVGGVLRRVGDCSGR